MRLSRTGGKRCLMPQLDRYGSGTIWRPFWFFLLLGSELLLKNRIGGFSVASAAPSVAPGWRARPLGAPNTIVSPPRNCRPFFRSIGGQYFPFFFFQATRFPLSIHEPHSGSAQRPRSASRYLRPRVCAPWRSKTVFDIAETRRNVS